MGSLFSFKKRDFTSGAAWSMKFGPAFAVLDKLSLTFIRTRRIKCDEGKPFCNRCVSTGRTCDGYTQTHSHEISVVERKSATRNLLPSQSTWTQLFPEQPPLDWSALNFGIETSMPSLVPFQNHDEGLYFRSYTDQVAFQLAGVFDPTLWVTLIPQACEQDNSVFHAVVAIGALDMAFRTRDCMPNVLSNPETEYHYQFAVSEYGKAISQLRAMTRVALRAHDLRIALFTSLLIICFEAIHGNNSAALAQAHIALRLLEDWMKSLKLDPRLLGNSNQQSEEISYVFDIRSPIPDMIEDELIRVFGRVNLQAMTFMDTQTVSYHHLASKSSQNSIDQMPRHFTDLEQARAYWDLIQRRLTHFMFVVDGQTGQELSGAKTGGEGLYNRDIGFMRRFSSSILADHQRLMIDLMKWSAAFQGILGTSQLAPHSENFLGAIVLQLRFKTNFILHSCAISNSQTSFDKFLPDFQEVLNLTKRLLAHPKAIPCCTFDNAIIAQLHVVATKCRNSNLRHEALSLLLSREWREGMWDSILFGRMAQVIVNTEEEEMDLNGFVPETARIRGTKNEFDEQTRIGVSQCYMSAADELGNPVVKIRPMTW